MNKIVLSGNLVEDVKFFKTDKKGTYYTKNKIAVQDNAKTEYEKTYFINFRAFNEDVLKTLKGMKKGTLIEIEGKLVHENYKKGDEWKSFTEVIVFKAKEIKFDKKKDNVIENQNSNEVNETDLPF